MRDSVKNLLLIALFPAVVLSGSTGSESTSVYNVYTSSSMNNKYSFVTIRHPVCHDYTKSFRCGIRYDLQEIFPH